MNCMYVKVIQASATITAIVRRRHFEFDYFGKRYVLNIDCSFKLWLGLMSNSWINWNAKQPHHHKITSTCVTLCTFSPNLCLMFNVDALSQIHFRFNSFIFHNQQRPSLCPVFHTRTRDNHHTSIQLQRTTTPPVLRDLVADVNEAEIQQGKTRQQTDRRTKSYE